MEEWIIGFLNEFLEKFEEFPKDPQEEFQT